MGLRLLFVAALVAAAFTLSACDCDGAVGVEDAGADRRDGDVVGVDSGAGAGEGGVDPQCGDLLAVIRDFRADHPDMEGTIQSVRGLVEDRIGPDQKPVYAHAGATAVTAGPDEFNQWYRDVDGVNMRFEIDIPLTEGPPGIFVFDDPDFFPLDGMGWPGEERLGHNFHFTTEIHATFTYRGGEVFTFRGDDDVFLFVNGWLALDLGGVHGVQSGTVDFDAMASVLEIVPGGTYTLDVFHAERHTSESNFRLETSIECFIII
jgi:fibro-slime domain-containing protein